MTSKEFMYFWNLGELYIEENKKIVEEGKKIDSLFLILEGKVAVSRETETLANLKRGDFVAEMSLVTEEPATADVTFSGQVKCMLWNQNKIRHLKKSNPDFWIKIHDVL